VRIAEERDIEAVRVQREKEEAAKHFAQGVSDALTLGIRVIDTEFQTDGNKLTIYFTSRRQIDFRRLQRQMFKQYRCRIWLVNWADVVKAK
jgi:cell fate regulator YaaT (PSP1 superfamily)